MTEPWFVCVELHMLPCGPRRLPWAGRRPVAPSRVALSAARRRGYRTAVLTTDRDLYGTAFDEVVDAWLVTDTSDIDCARDALRRLDGGIAAVFSPVDAFVRTAGALARRLGLPGPDPRGVGVACDKSLARRALAEAGVPDIRWGVAPAAAENLASPIGYPCVVKPVDGVSSWDVALADTDADVRDLAGRHLRRRYRRRLSPRRLLVFEEFLDGPLFSAEGFVTREGVTVFGYTDRVLSPPPCFVEIAGSFAADRPCPGADAFVEDCLAALGYDFGPFHLEFVVTRDGPRLVELNPRFIGAGTHQAIGYVTGRPLGELLVAYLTGESAPEFSCVGAATDLSLVPPATGVLRGYKGLDAAAAAPGCQSTGLYAALGDHVSAVLESNSQWCGYVQTVGTDRDDSYRKALAASAHIVLDIA